MTTTRYNPSPTSCEYTHQKSKLVVLKAQFQRQMYHSGKQVKLIFHISAIEFEDTALMRTVPCKKTGVLVNLPYKPSISN